MSRHAWYWCTAFYLLAVADGHWKNVLVGTVIGLVLAFAQGIWRYGWPWTWGRR